MIAIDETVLKFNKLLILKMHFLVPSKNKICKDGFKI